MHVFSRLKSSIIICFLLSIVTFVIYSFLNIMVPLNIKKPVEVYVKKGMTFSETLQRLQAEGLIRDKNIVLLIAKITRIDRKIKTGLYEFSGPVSPLNVINALISGRVAEFDVTIPEGYNIRQIASTLDAAGIITEEQFFRLAYNRKFLDSMNIDAPSIEGYIFPDTYSFPRGMPPEDVLKTLVSEMRKHFTRGMKKRAEKLGLSEREVLTLASIIEKEARVDDERPLISAVFHNRLKRGMPLQSDPTTIYGFKSPSGVITIKDLKRESPYNTYVIRGLPPGPIASPGLKSIMAALYPADVPYLFFVSDNNGRHRFSTTEAEHRKAVMLYREMKRGK
ncbi:MAG TPA: endolytic transglycosylase MltG [Nitrospirae bacterium]|nr:endolytic transglycosylase MltG [Nitrospirota bacterium]